MSKQTLRSQVRTSLKALTQQDIQAQSARITELLLAHPAYKQASRISIYISKPNAAEVSTLAIIHDILSKSGSSDSSSSSSTVNPLESTTTPPPAPPPPTTTTTKSCFIPRCVSKTRMEMVRLTSLEDLQSLPLNKMGIPEPLLSEPRENIFDNAVVARQDSAYGGGGGGGGGYCDLIVMPLLAFDADGWRLGHGGGYYDRFLVECNSVNARNGRGPPVTIALALKQQFVVGSVPRDEYDQKPDYILLDDGR
ncbi:5-formyltetrahydrofolate cyclo-ligase family-domain-containing protein [Obelidium mucronatum]|nr:5-formyltetrahydrofolate cyclo-ligase family-domain-containing protein [Obelidium mucronatum]